MLNAIEIQNAITEKVNFSSLYVPKAGEHGLNMFFSLGKCLPQTKAQAKRFLKIGSIGVLHDYDVRELIEPLLIKHGFKGVYKLTKSGRNCRLVNQYDLFQAIKKEYSC